MLAEEIRQAVTVDAQKNMFTLKDLQKRTRKFLFLIN